jgi:hypothetical protein
MAQNIGTLLGAPVRPADSLDQFPAFHADEGKGGFYSVADLTARNAIFNDRRAIGMRVKVISEDKDYELVGGITNSDWVEKVYSVGTTVHNELTGRDESDAHPISAITGLQTELKKLQITIELLDLQNFTFYAPQDLKINSIENIVATPTTTIEVNDIAYTLGNVINQGSKIEVLVNVESVINLLGSYE